jgi:hypothetical protein
MSVSASRSGRAWDALSLASVAGAVLFFVQRILCREGVPSTDIYGAHYPVLVYAWRSLRSGHGLLWNSLQNCGQPFLPSTPPGMLYPLNALFLVFGLDRGWAAAAVLHMAIGGAGLFYLCRGYGLGRQASLCGAYVFAVGGLGMGMAAWVPTSNLGAYVWIPVAIAGVERVFRHPTVGRGLWLGTALTLQLLAGCPQISLFTYQVIALRILWEVPTIGVQRLGATLAVLALGLVLPVGLGAASLFPSLEFWGLSVRSHPLSLGELQPDGPSGWQGLRKALLPQAFSNRLVTIVSLALAAAAPAVTGRRRVAIFYLVVGALYLLLSANETAFAFYMTLPFGRMFRYPSRFVMVSTFALSVLAGLGAQAVLEPGGRRGSAYWIGLAAASMGALAFAGLAGSLTLGNLWVLIPVAVAPACIAATAGVLRARVTRVAGLSLAAVLLVELYSASARPFLTFLPDGSVLWQEAAAFEFVKEKMTPFDRIFSNAAGVNYSVMGKSASVFGVPSIIDYEPQTSLRYAELYLKATFNAELLENNMFSFSLTRPFVIRPLVNLLAARWVIVAGKPGVPFAFPLGPGYVERWRRGDVAVFENPAALPRAYYVPRLEVVQDRQAILNRLASPTHKPRQVALVEEAPADGFLGEVQTGFGIVASLTDQSELVTLRVMAMEPGFVVLTDQDYPGWVATVGGVPTPILRVNHAFRAVRVPAGPSLIEFRYRPRSVWLGAAVSAATLVGMAIIGAVGMRRDRGSVS